MTKPVFDDSEPEDTGLIAWLSHHVVTPTLMIVLLAAGGVWGISGGDGSITILAVGFSGNARGRPHASQGL